MYFVQQSLNTVSYLFLTKEGSPLVPEIDENEISQNKQGALTPLSIHLAILVSIWILPPVGFEPMSSSPGPKL